MLDYSQPAGTYLRWHNPPGWPERHPKWTPPVGWQPDPSWPPAPDGWVFWPPTEGRANYPRQKKYGLAVFLNVIFPGLGLVYINVGRRAIPFLAASAVGQVLTTVGQSHHAKGLAIAGTLVWATTFIVSVGDRQMRAEGLTWRPSGRNTKAFAIAWVVLSAAIVIAIDVKH